MKKAFVTAAMFGFIGLAAAQADQPAAQDCQVANSEDHFTLAFNQATHKATLQGNMKVPGGGYSYQLIPSTHFSPDSQTYDMELIVKAPDMGSQAITTLKINETFDVPAEKQDVFVHVLKHHMWGTSGMSCSLTP